MKMFNLKKCSTAVALILVSFASQAGLIGRDLDTNTAGFEAYYDDILDITWLADTDYAYASGYRTSWPHAAMSHAQALAWVDQLSIGGYDNWRLPSAGLNPLLADSISHTGATNLGWYITRTTSELSHLFYVTLGNSGSPSGSCGNYNFAPSCLQNTGPFLNMNIQSAFWYQEERNTTNQTSWMFSTYNGVQSWTSATALGAWAVADGDIARSVAEVSEPAPISILLGVFGLMVLNRKMLQKVRVQTSQS